MEEALKEAVTKEFKFPHGDLTEAIAIALRFTLSVPGVHTAIVGTTKPERIKENTTILEAGPLPKGLFEKISSRWREVADDAWVGQT